MAGDSYYLGKKHEGVVLKQNACTCVSVYRVLCGFLVWWKSVNVSVTGEWELSPGPAAAGCSHFPPGPRVSACQLPPPTGT